MKHAAVVLTCILCFTYATASAQTITSARYVDATGGNDANDGTSPATAWQSLAKVNAQTFGPGAQILFKAGETWTGRLAPQGSGASGSPIVISSYGTGDKPAIHGNGAVNEVIYLFNQSFWEITNLEITNLGPTAALRRGIYIRAQDVGKVEHLHLKNLEVHDINSDLASFSSRYYGGIFLEVTGSTTPTYFDDLLIEDNHVYDVDRTGISMQSSWQIRSRTSTWGQQIAPGEFHNWTPSQNVVIRGNLIERSGGNGIIVRVSENALVEYNTMLYNGEQISGNAAFCFNTDGTVFQFNEAAYTVYNAGDTDARGIDSDYRTKGTIIQFNYLHHNGKGGVVATGGAGGTNGYKNFNDGTIIRYNILVENAQHSVRVSGKLTNMRMHNNVIYTSSALNGQTIIEHGSWSGATPNGVQYYSNIIDHRGGSATYALTAGTNIHFRNNIFHYGGSVSNQPSDPYGIFANPRFWNPSPSATIDDLSGFKIHSNSPAVGAGVRYSDLPNRDYFGNAISAQALVDIGAHQVVGNRPEFLEVSADAYVRGGPYSSDKYGTADELHLKKHSDSEFIRRVFLKFDPASAYSDITSVRLRLFAWAASGQNAHTRFVADDSWSESTLDWSVRPTMGAASDTVKADGIGMFEWDVTDLVLSELESGNVVSLAVDALETAGSGANLTKFFSREEPADSRRGVRPMLLIRTDPGASKNAVDVVSGVPNVAEVGETTLFPNPTTGLITLRLADAPSGTVRVTVHDVLGRQVWREERSEAHGDLALDLAGLPSGVYVVTVELGDRVESHKIVLVR